jgi:hypothetical protein
MSINTRTVASHIIGQTEQSHMGWHDFYTRQPYPSDYDSWSEQDQRNYENGRLRAANVSLMTKLPARQSVRLIRLASLKVGKAIPPRRINNG